jgi:hypothetical protein
MKIVLSESVMELKHKESLGFPGTNPNIQIVSPEDADFIWYACLGDGDALRSDLRELDMQDKPVISVVLGDHDYRNCLSGSNLYRHFSCAIDDWLRCVPCIYRAVRRTERPKDILASFIGSFSTHPSRPELLKLAGEDVVVEQREWWGTGQTESSPNRVRYDEVMERSRFTLCPRGFGPTSMRLPDAILCGSIPIMIDDKTRPFGQDLGGFALWSGMKAPDISYALGVARDMSDEEYNRRRELMLQFAEKYLLRDLNSGCTGTLGYTEWIREMVEP